METCTQCGRCCIEEICQIGQDIFETNIPPCPGLHTHDGKFWCRVVEVAKDTEEYPYKTHIKLTIGIGMGCDAATEVSAL